MYIFLFTFDLLLGHPGVPSDLCNPCYPGDGDTVARDGRHGDTVTVNVLEENFGVPSGQSAGLSMSNTRDIMRKRPGP